MASTARHLDVSAPMGPSSRSVSLVLVPAPVPVAPAVPEARSRGLRPLLGLPLALALTSGVLVGASTLVGSWA